MTENLDETKSKQQIIEINKTVVIENNESFGYDIEIIQKIIFNTNTTFFNLISDKKHRIILKAYIATASICFCQPFNEGNKRTVFTFMLNFLHKNEFTIELPDKDEFAALLSNKF